MNINKLSNHINERVNGTHSADGDKKTGKVSGGESKDLSADKVTIERYNQRNEKLFAEIELEKLHQNSLNNLKNYKAKIQEYEEAKAVSDDLARQTEIGKKINDPDTWGEIAQKMLGNS